MNMYKAMVRNCGKTYIEEWIERREGVDISDLGPCEHY